MYNCVQPDRSGSLRIEYNGCNDPRRMYEGHGFCRTGLRGRIGFYVCWRQGNRSTPTSQAQRPPSPVRLRRLPHQLKRRCLSAGAKSSRFA